MTKPTHRFETPQRMREQTTERQKREGKKKGFPRAKQLNCYRTSMYAFDGFNGVIFPIKKKKKKRQ